MGAGVFEAPAGVAVFEAHEIAKMPAKTLAKMLRGATPLAVKIFMP